ncbi:MAG: YfiR family protein [Methylomicrobium sp.]
MIEPSAETAVAGLQRGIVYTLFRRNGWIWRFLVAAIFLASLSPLLAGAETEDERLQRVKAAFVLNIARFVSWPKEALEQQGDSLQLCLYRRNPLAEATETIEGKIVNGRTLRINLIKSLAQSPSCNILLIGLEEIQHFDEESRHAPTSPLLTIADLTDIDIPPPHQHALVTLVRNDARIGFEINLAKARRAKLQMSSNLLKLAKIVGDGT